MRTHHKEIDLFEAMLVLKNPKEYQAFFSDLCTPQEMRALKERWKVCQLLDRGDLSYRDIRDLTGASLTTISRVARFLKEESYKGYQTILKKLKSKP